MSFKRMLCSIYSVFFFLKHVCFVQVGLYFHFGYKYNKDGLDNGFLEDEIEKERER